jgi:lipopolysaccharide export system protein LptA
MNRSRCSSGRRPEGPALPGASPPRPPGSRLVPASRCALAATVLPTVLLMRLPTVLLAGLLVAATPAWAPPLPAEASGEPPSCPPERELCVQAEQTGGIDLKTGVAHLEGHVRGLMRSRDLRFGGDSVTAYRDGGQEWVRLVLEKNVHLSQRGRESSSDHGVLERDEVRLNGNVHIAQTDLSVQGSEADFRADGSRVVVRGEPGAPLTLEVPRALIAEDASFSGAPSSAAPSPGAPQGTPPGSLQRGPPATPLGGPGDAEVAEPPGGPVTSTLHALKAVLEDQPRRAVLTGQVQIEQSDGRLRLDADQATLLFGPDSALESFRAEGNVVIAQPDRHITADYAQSRNQLHTILLVGHATMQQQGMFDLKSDRMEVYADASKGILQTHDRQKPITLSLDLAGGGSYGITQSGMLKLSQKNVPPAVLDKLAPLIGKTFDSRSAFREAVAARLTRREGAAYLETIVANAR